VSHGLIEDDGSLTSANGCGDLRGRASDSASHWVSVEGKTMSG